MEVLEIEALSFAVRLLAVLLADELDGTNTKSFDNRRKSTDIHRMKLNLIECLRALLVRIPKGRIVDSEGEGVTVAVDLLQSDLTLLLSHQPQTRLSKNQILIKKLPI